MSRDFPHPRRATQAPAAEFELLLIDGDNLLHRVRGSRDEGGLRWLLPRLRAWLPDGAQVIVMLDGHPDPGEVLRRRVAPGIEFQHSGNVDGDTALLAILAARPYADRARTLLVTDDRGLTDKARHGGGLTRRLDWLTVQLARATDSPDTGRSGRAIRGSGGTPMGIGRGRSVWGTDDLADPSEDRKVWRPGRGATRKMGNPKRGHPR
jgi:hypothetical protein